MVELYLIRHGIAAEPEEYSNDADRPLTDEGKRKTRKVAARLSELNLRFDLILTSPLVRARQTADILQTAKLSDRLEESLDLAFDGDMEAWLSWFEQWRQKGDSSLALVGHQPNLGNWAEILIWGEACGRLVVKKAGAIGLTLPGTGSPVGRSQLFWLASPKFLFVP
ncbi:phosphohistidine phosphatase SixA [Argonema antarcticum]|uniref:phosphohistidine phosphatase SixA n=1 Tax=Argonema antarcticum TaxID=2942763 RepID=UPI002011C540|nr:phosphohistidine phosphatase SixA [Argonema antarcticum]MCL1474621.1 phosphohistidine phosphatase SixA [Argonema antarcticum A004/B2]